MVIPTEDSVITEMTSTLRDWGTMWKQLYVVTNFLMTFFRVRIGIDLSIKTRYLKTQNFTRQSYDPCFHSVWLLFQCCSNMKVIFLVSNQLGLGFVKILTFKELSLYTGLV